MRSITVLNVESEVIASESVVCKQQLWGHNVEAFQFKWGAEDRFDSCMMGGDIVYAQESYKLYSKQILVSCHLKKYLRFLLSFVFRGGVTTQLGSAVSTFFSTI